MPLTSFGLTGAIITGLSTVGFVGSAMPKLAQGIGNGLALWAKSISVTSVDIGSVGVGTGLVAWAVPRPLLNTNLQAAYPIYGHIGSMAPLEAAGLATGLSLGFTQGIVTTQHLAVGVGSGVVRFTGGPAFNYLMQGFAGVDIRGDGAVKKASAISQALAATLAVFTLTVTIVGSASPYSVSGVGAGRIL